MGERLIIRLASQPCQPISWLVFNDKDNEVMASGVLKNSDELTLITDQAANRVVDVLVPGEDVGYFEVALPKANRRQAIKAVPYMLEDELASPVESMHFVYAKALGDVQGVYVCQHQKMTSWLGQLAIANIKTKHFLIDYLTLPAPAENVVSVLQLDKNILLRHGVNQGQTVEKSWLPIVLNELPKEGTPTLEYVGLDEQLRNADYDWQEQSIILPMQQLALGSRKGGINLLCGQYAQKDKTQSNHWQVWRTAVVAGVVALMVYFVDIYLQAQQLEQQRAVVKQQIESIYRQLNPGVKRVRTGLVKKQMTTQLAALGSSNQRDDMLAMLVTLNDAFKQVPTLKPLTIKYDNKRQEIRLQADAKNYQEFDKFKQILSRQYSVTPGAINNDGNKVNGSLIIKATS